MFLPLAISPLNLGVSEPNNEEVLACFKAFTGQDQSTAKNINRKQRGSSPTKNTAQSRLVLETFRFASFTRQAWTSSQAFLTDYITFKLFREDRMQCEL